jgi:hypothetical protein
MINLLNKIFSRFNLQVVSKEEPHKGKSFVEDITSPEFMKKHPEFLDRYVEGQKNKSLYVGDIQYLQDKNGKTYYQDLRSKTYYCDYDMKNTSKKVLGLMIKETTFTPDELAEKLKND